MQRIKDLLFGSISEIAIHTTAAEIDAAISARVLASLKALAADAPMSIRPARLDAEFVMIHYTAGLLRPAHAEVMVLH